MSIPLRVAFAVLLIVGFAVCMYLPTHISNVSVAVLCGVLWMVAWVGCCEELG